MATTDQFSLRWNNFHSNLTSGFLELLEASEMVDVTLAVEGHFLQAHKIVLSICSPYFKEMFKVNPCKHPIVILKDVGHDNMRHILDFMYMGEVNVLRENLSTFLRTAELLQVKGLTGDDTSETSSRRDDKSESNPDNDVDDSELMSFSHLIDSDVDLPPVHYSTPRVPTPTSQISVAPPPQPTASSFPINKRQPKSHNCNSKRVKTENSATKCNKIENEMNHFDDVDLVDGKQLKIEPKQLTSDGNCEEINKNHVENNITVSETNSQDQGKPDNGKCNNRNAYRCEKCYKLFSRRDHLRTHEKNIHGEDAGPFACVICNQLYKNTESLRKHIAKFHFPKIANDVIPKVEVHA